MPPASQVASQQSSSSETLRVARFSSLRSITLTLILALVTGAGACNRDDDEARAEVQRLALVEGDAESEAVRVVHFGRRALPPIEAALHTADVPGRKNLVMALRRIGDIDSVSLLLHIAAYDAATDVRKEAEWTLRGFAAGGDAVRADKAKAALRELEEIRNSEAAG